MHVPTFQSRTYSLLVKTNKVHNNMEFFTNHSGIKSLNGKKFILHCQQEGNPCPLGVYYVARSNTFDAT